MSRSSDEALRRPVASADDVQRFVLALVRDDPRPYAQRAGQSLRSVAALLAALQHPERGMRFAHIAGSKGKGSVALMLEALLRGAGLEVGTYTSPHLTRWNERVRIHGEPVSDEALVRAMAAVQPHVLALLDADPAGRPSFFDALTVAAVWLMRQADCQIAVLECGLGGRFDATNALDPEVSCITSIELEHTDKLGPTHADIAWHKAGIARRGRPLVCGPVNEASRQVIQAVCREVGASLHDWGEAFQLSLQAVEGQRRRIRVVDGGEHFDLLLGHRAPQMALNAALALAMARRLGIEHPPAGALADIQLPGRAQVLRESPTVLVDGAHTTASLSALAQSVEGFAPGKRVFVVSVSGGKELGALSALLRGAKLVVVTRADRQRSMETRQLANALSAGLEPGSGTVLLVEPTPSLALERALTETARDEVLCVCGSVYMAGHALRQLSPSGAG